MLGIIFFVAQKNQKRNKEIFLLKPIVKGQYLQAKKIILY